MFHKEMSAKAEVAVSGKTGSFDDIIDEAYRCTEAAGDTKKVIRHERVCASSQSVH